MSLDQSESPLSLDEAIQYGRTDAVERLEALARHEAERGDCRAMNALTRLIEAAGLRRKG